MRSIFLILFLAALFVSCSQKDKFPEYSTLKVPKNQLFIKTSDSVKTDQNSLGAEDMELPNCLEDLSVLENQYKNRNPDFNFAEMKDSWERCKNELTNLNRNNVALGKWEKVTGLLFQLTTDAKYAEELERLFYKISNTKISMEVAGYAITKNVDHLHVNLFIPVKLEYGHSLGGNVSVEMETGYPESGKAKIIFNVEEKRYVELFIRIPSQAKDAHVTAGGVKYLAQPGEYCKIARKWKDGDSVQIEFSNNYE